MKIDDPNYPHLVSFPRCGSHWIRSLIEIYFKNKDKNEFQFRNAKYFKCNHVHDMDLSYKLYDVIYLYRNPFDVIYSSMCYYKFDLKNMNKIDGLIKQYCDNILKWMYNEDFTKKKTIITYENMLETPHEEFSKICNHFGEVFDKERFDKIGKVSKEFIKSRTTYDKKIINISENYDSKKEQFREEYEKHILHRVHFYNNHLSTLFEKQINKVLGDELKDGNS